MQPVLEYKNVSKVYAAAAPARQFYALHDFSLAVEPGEIFGFLGPNGAGKSTAIHIAMGLNRAEQGSGAMLGHAFGHARTRRRVGFLSEHTPLYARNTEETVRFYGRLNGVEESTLRRRTRELLEEFGLGNDLRKDVRKLSRGMIQKVGLAHALVNDPELLILDEPTSALDPAARIGVREMLVRRKREGKTIFLSSHMLSEIELICDRIAILNKGRLVRIGRPNDLLVDENNTEIVAQGVSATGWAHARVEGNSLRIVVPASEQRAAIEKIWSGGGTVASVNPLRRTLEDLFIELTAQPEQPQ